MNFKLIFFITCAIFVQNSVFSQDGSNTMWYGTNGILQQNLAGSSATQTEIVHTIVNATNLSDWEIEVLRKPEIETIYVNFLNQFIGYYVDTKSEVDSYSWYRYDEDGSASVSLRRPFHRMYFVIVVTQKDIESRAFNNIQIVFSFTDSEGKEIRRPDQGLSNLSTDNFNKAAMAMDRSFRELGVSIPSDGTGFPIFNLDGIVQRDIKTIEQYYLEGLIPDKINPSPGKRKK